MTVKNGPLPKGWREVKLGELCSDIAYGYTATASNEPVGPKFLRITDIVSDSINWESVPYCEIEGSKKRKYTLETGDIVIARTGATTGYNQVIRSNEHSVFASYLIRYKLKQDIAYPFFIGCVLKSTYWKRYIEKIKARSAQPGANAKDFANFKISLPTFPEQKAIASLLEKWDTTIEKTEALIEAKEKRFKWLLKTLISDQQDNPEWRQVKLEEVGVIHSGGTPSTRDSSNWNGDILWLTPSEVTRLSEKYINSTERQITRKGLSRTTLLPENCLIVCTRATIGNCCINTVPMAINQGFKCIQPHRRYSVTFLYYAFLLLKTRLIRLSCGNTFGEVSKKDFANILISVPSLFEQKAIAAHLDTAQQEIYLLNQLAEQYRMQKRGLMQKLLTGEWRVKPNTKARM